MGKTKIAYSFIKNKDNFFRLGFNPLILMLFVELYKQKGKMKEKISNMKGKIQIEVKDVITNHSESVSDSILFTALIFRHVNHSINTSTERNTRL